MERPLLSLKGVRKSFGGSQALSNGALDLYSGQITALVGENGAGKSTLVKVITGVHQPDGGEITLDGQVVRVSDPLKAQALGICAVHQETAIFDNLSVTENIFAANPMTRNGVLDWAGMRKRAHEILESLDTEIDLNVPARRLSVGQKHLVQIARALVQKARVLILDEPTAALSHREADDLIRIVKRLRDEGCALLFISHKFEEVFALCDRYAVFRDGAAVGQGKVADVNTDQLIAMMVGREVSQIYPPGGGELGEEALRVENLGRDREFEGVSFSVRHGEIFGFYGLVGAGRSEVAEALFGLSQPDSGALWVEGKKSSFSNPAQAIRAGLALVPEDRQRQGAALTLPIQENMALASLDQSAKLGFIDSHAERQRASALVTQLGVKCSSLDAPVQSLSGGNQQKVVLAKWVAADPRVLILDEPTKGVDIGAKAAVHSSIRAMAERGVAVIMVSSDLPEMLGMADRIAVMRRGQVMGIIDRANADAESVMRLATDG